MERGLGDDQSPRGMWGDLDPWLSSLWTTLLQLKPLPAGTVVDDSPRLEAPLFRMSPVDTVNESTKNPVKIGVTSTLNATHVAGATPGQTQLTHTGASTALMRDITRAKQIFHESMAPPMRTGHEGGPPRPARLLTNNRITAEDHFQDVRHLEFDVAGVPGGKNYGPGDVAWVHPSNDNSAVEELAGLMKLGLDQVVRIIPAVLTAAKASTAQQSNTFTFPGICSIRVLLRDVLDILGTPRRSFFERLSLFADDPEEKEKLQELASPGGADLLYEYATREKRTFVEVMRDFPSCQVPPERLLELIPRLRPRGFSIASSSLETPSTLHICMAVVSFR